MVMSVVHQVWPNHLASHIERGEKTRQTEKEVGIQHQGMDRPGVRQVPLGSGEQGKLEKTGCKIICGAPMTLAVKGLMMMMILSLALFVCLSVFYVVYIFGEYTASYVMLDSPMKTGL